MNKKLIFYRIITRKSNQQKSVYERKMDIGIILAFVFGILTVIGVIYTIWQVKLKNEELTRENERLKKEIATIKAENIEEYPSRDLRKIVELLSKATHEISILGLIAGPIIHESHSNIVNFINNHNGKVRILIANPNSRYFNNWALKEKDHIGRLLQAHKSSIMELRSILSKINPERKRNLIIKMYNDLPTDISLQIVDNKEMYVNERVDEGVSVHESPMYKVSKERMAQRITFEYFKKIFEDAWNNKNTEEITLNT